MTPFLKKVAQYLYAQTGGNFEGLTIIFPNKRAGLFFNKYLREMIDRPVWAPQYMTIDELYKQLSNKQLIDPIELVCRLYRVYVKVTGRTETLDHFYSWGEMMCRDFDDIDNSMVPADKLLANVNDLEQLKDFSFLTEEQRKAIGQYFTSYACESDTKLKKKFTQIWELLHPLYIQLRETLAADGLAYSGMLKREVVETLRALGDGPLPDFFKNRKFAIIGFNVLTETEKEFFRELKRRVEVKFFWDFDWGYTNLGATDDNNSVYEAGQFIKENIHLFGNEFDNLSDEEQGELFGNFCAPKNFKYVAAATESQQTRYVEGWIKEQVQQEEDMVETAVVLCNEKNLQPLLHSIPGKTNSGADMLLNITMGYPLSETPIASFLLAVAELQVLGTTGRGWRHGRVLSVLTHPYAQRLGGDEAMCLRRKLVDEKIFFPTDADLHTTSPLSIVFQHVSGNESLLKYLSEVTQAIGMTFKTHPSKGVMEQLYCESVFVAYTLINRLNALERQRIEGEEGSLLAVEGYTLLRLLRTLINGRTIPFHGEPAEGVQLLGLLETRCLDFRNVVLLSANEGTLPDKNQRSSFIPYNLREAYGMTTIEKQVSLSAYYFYRLISRATNVSLLYNVSTDGMQTGEMSRFLAQLLAEVDNAPVSSKAKGKYALLSPQSTFEFLALSNESETSKVLPIQVKKTPEVMQRLYKMFDVDSQTKKRFLSPSALNVYMGCPLHFYLRYGLGLYEEDELSEDVDSRQFGSIFHDAMEQLYTPFVGKVMQRSDIDMMLNDDVLLDETIRKAFARVFYNVKDEQKLATFKLRLNGEQEINRVVIKKYVKNQLLYDLEMAPIKICGLEENVEHIEEVMSGDKKIRVLLGGIIDRRDEVTYAQHVHPRIVDYKTSQTRHVAKDIDELFDPDIETRPDYVFQTFYYSYVMAQKWKSKGEDLMPTLMYIKLCSKSMAEIKNKETDPVKRADKLIENMCVTMGVYPNKLIVSDFSEYYDEFVPKLRAHLSELFDPQRPFVQTACKKHCTYCEFAQICGRLKDKK